MLIRKFKIFESNKDKTLLIIDEFRKKHLDKYDYSKVRYVNNRTNVEIICPKHGSFFQTPYTHKKGSNCPSCSNRKRLTNIDFINKAKEIHGDLYDYSDVEYKNNSTKVRIRCPKHGFFEQTPNDHTSSKAGCPYCYGYKNTSVFIKDAIKLHGTKYDYSKVLYKSAHGKVPIICPKHGEFHMSYNSHVTKGYICPLCSESSGESYIANFLKVNNIEFEYQKKFDNCFNKRILSFDFYLKDKNLIIEYDGRHHFMPIWGGSEALDLIQKRDHIKNIYCKNNNINILRIKYNDDINSKLNSIL